MREEKRSWSNEYFLSLWQDHISEGVLIVEKRTEKILFVNHQTRKLIRGKDFDLLENLGDIFNEKDICTLKNENSLVLELGKNVLKITAEDNEELMVILVQDFSENKALQKKNEDLNRINQELMNIYEEYAEDTIGIIDADGTIQVTGDTFATYCGVSLSHLIGKNVLDLERDKVFYPSVWARVMESKHMEVVLQNSKTGNQRICFGYPVRDEEGNIKNVISITKGFQRQVKLGEMLSTVTRSSEDFLQERLKEYEGQFSTCNVKMIQIIGLAKTVAETDATVLISGETGVGKQVLANYIQNHSIRKGKPYIKVNCGAIAPSLVESELFGYVSGSFTGANKEGKQGLLEAANNGTLLLDDVSELPLEQQVKLLHVIQEKSMTRVGGTENIPLDIRIIATSNKNLNVQVERGEFREDLFYRLSVIPFEIPPLRERREDITLLIRYFLRKYNEKYNKEVELFEEVFCILKEYNWPGNVRELENTIERIVVTAGGTFVDESNLPPYIKSRGEHAKDVVAVESIMPLNKACEELERKLIRMALDEKGTEKDAAELLEISPSTISRKIIALGIRKNHEKS